MAVREYATDEIVVGWNSDLCTHSARCFNELREVFDPKARPWVNINGAVGDVIARQVDRCPSGALRWKRQGESSWRPHPTQDATIPVTVGPRSTVQVMKGGPIRVTGPVAITLADGTVEAHERTVALCRCGHSHGKPYCDGSHARAGFEG